MGKLDNTWYIIAIGNREYAVNSSLVIGVAELKPTYFVKSDNKRFVYGYYTLFGKVMPVLDGFAIACESPNKETGTEFAKAISSIKEDVHRLVNNGIWDVSFGDNATVSKDTEAMYESASRKLAELNYGGDKYIERLVKSVSTYLDANWFRIKATAKIKSACDRSNEIDEIERDVKLHVQMALDNISDVYSKNTTDMCLVVNTSRGTFGICIDYIRNIVESTNQADTSNKMSKLSAGSIKIGTKTYNVLDLAKVSSVI